MSPLWPWHLVIGVVTGLIAVALTIFTRRLLSHWKTVSVSLLLFLLAWSVCLWLVLTSMTNPPANWGYPRTVEGFIHVVSRGQYERFNPIGSFHALVGQAAWYAANAASDLGGIYLVPAVIPLFFLRRMQSRERWRM